MHNKEKKHLLSLTIQYNAMGCNAMHKNTIQDITISITQWKLYQTTTVPKLDAMPQNQKGFFSVRKF